MPSIGRGVGFHTFLYSIQRRSDTVGHS